jgi:hypothetical protein
MDTSASPMELQEEDLDTISAGKNLHFGHFGKLHFGKIHFGSSVEQTNIAIAIGVAIGGSVLQTIGQSNISNFTI